MAGVALAAALVFATTIASKSFEYTQRSQITVKGFAAKAIVSDLAHWEGVIQTRNRDLSVAYRNLESDRKAVVVFLEKLEVPLKLVEFSATRTEILRKKEGYSETNVRTFKKWYRGKLQISTLLLFWS